MDSSNHALPQTLLLLKSEREVSKRLEGAHHLRAPSKKRIDLRSLFLQDPQNAGSSFL